MGKQWLKPECLKPDDRLDIWNVDYTAHPMLDPAFPDQPSRLRRFIRMAYERIIDDDRAYQHEAARLLRPPHDWSGTTEGSAADVQQISAYLHEADIYLASTIELLPPRSQAEVRPNPEVSRNQDLRDLLDLVMRSDSPRTRFEAQRKLYLARLLVDIDHSRHIQEGPRHKAYFEELLKEAAWRHTRQVNPLTIGFHMDPDGETIHYTSRPTEKDQLWRFQSIFMEKGTGDQKISLDILYYTCRFKRSVVPISFEIVDGQHQVVEKERWEAMRQQSSGSILSKMIRKGINNADLIQDLIGAMFIVHDEDGLNDLLQLLDGSIGNPFGWRNVTDTFARDDDRNSLDQHSGRGYKVYKGDVDILAPTQAAGDPPYRFTVEIQIYTLEGYLRTVCGSHEASHQALKLRQFLYGLAPMLFPRAIYGTAWLQLN
ncbi:MAG: hypothetical protein ABIF77_02120 [bacterium]